MDTHNTESFNKDFCEHLEYHLGRTFKNSEDSQLKGLWCDGIVYPFVESQLSKEVLLKTGTIITNAFIGPDGQDEYEMTIIFGPLSIDRYANDSDMIDCLPSEKSADWIKLDIEKRKIELRLK